MSVFSVTVEAANTPWRLKKENAPPRSRNKHRTGKLLFLFMDQVLLTFFINNYHYTATLPIRQLITQDARQACNRPICIGILLIFFNVYKVLGADMGRPKSWG